MKFINKYKLFENPNAIQRNYRNINWIAIEDETYAFSYYNGEFCILQSKIHQELFYKYMSKFNIDDPNIETLYSLYDRDQGRGEYSGRIFSKDKIITFWKFPENKQKLKDIVKDIEKETSLKIWDDPEYKVEVITDMSKINIDDCTWGTWKPTDDPIEYIPLKDYTGSIKRNADELKQQHILSPMDKDRKVPYKKSKNFKEWQKPFEGKLNENPEYIIDREPIETATGHVDYKEKEIANWQEEDARAFGYYNNILYLGNDIHSRISPTNSRHDMKFPGRLWLNKKIISFWGFPNDKQYKNIIKDLSEDIGEDIWDSPEWRVEIIVDDDSNKTHPSEINWDDQTWFNGNNKAILIPVREYIGKDRKHRTPEEMKKQHLNLDRDFVPGFGSDKETKWKKWQKPFESKDLIKKFDEYKKFKSKEELLYDEISKEILDFFNSYINEHRMKDIGGIENLLNEKKPNIQELIDAKEKFDEMDNKDRLASSIFINDDDCFDFIKKHKINVFDNNIFDRHIIDSNSSKKHITLYKSNKWMDYQLENFPETINEIIKRFTISIKIKLKYKELFDSEELGLL